MAAPELPPLTLPQMLARQARERGARAAIRQKEFGIWNPVSWEAYHARARHVGHGLLALGLAPGAHVAVLSENRIEWVLAQLGAGLAGMVAVGVYATSPAPEVAYVLAHSDAEVVVCEDQEQADKVIETRAELPRLRRIVVVETKGMRAYDPALVLSFRDLERLGREDAARRPARLDPLLEAQTLDDTALLIYTSGSTGKPKGAMLSHANLRAQAAVLAERLGLSERDSHLSYLPLCHVAEQMLTTMGPIYLGYQVNFGESLRTVQEDLREVAPTIFLGVPRIWEKLHAAIHIRMLETGGARRRLYERALAACEGQADTPRARWGAAERARFALWHALVFRALQNHLGLRRCRVVMTGAAPISPRIVRSMRTIGLPLVELYGATETSGVCLGQRLESIAPGTVGEPALGCEARLGAQGELLVRGPTIFQGYHKDAEATARAIRGGWLHTGDVAAQEGGQWRIVDRLKDILITAGGKNLSPSEIENTLKGSPYIKEAVVIGESRRFVSALVQIDPDTVARWAEERGLTHTTFRSLAENPAVRALIEAEVEEANRALAPVSRVRRFHLLAKALDHDDGEVTATMKVRRTAIAQRYGAEIEALYAA